MSGGLGAEAAVGSSPKIRHGNFAGPGSSLKMQKVTIVLVILHAHFLTINPACCDVVIFDQLLSALRLQVKVEFSFLMTLA